VKLDVISLEARAGAQGGRAGALPPSPSGLPFVPVASGLFWIKENCTARNYLVVNMTCGPSLHIF